MTIELFEEMDMPFIRAGSEEYNGKMAEINDTVRIALGLVSEGNIASLGRKELVMSMTYKGVQWEVRKDEKKLRAYAFRYGEKCNIYNSGPGGRTPFEEVDSLRWSLHAFLNAFAKQFPSIYCDLMTLRATGRAALKAESAKRSCGSGMHFMLSRKVKAGHWDQLGYVVAENGVAAAKKMGLEITGRQETDRVTYLSLEGLGGVEYSLESFQEITGFIRGLTT